MKNFTLIFFSLIAISAFGQEYHRDMNVFRVGGESQRSEIVFSGAKADAMKSGAMEASENYVSLNGTWEFSYNGHPWCEIQVPGNWERQGHGDAYYTNIPYDFCPRNPQPPILPDEIELGVYKTSFSVPAWWEGRQIYLNLCGAKSGVYVYINGELVGYSEDSKSLHRYNITPYIKPENELILKIYRYSTGSFLEDQDFWRISGIERDVYLSSEKADKGFDFGIVATLDESLQNGIFELTVSTKQPIQFTYELLDGQGNVVLSSQKNIGSSTEKFTGKIEHPAQWSAETPNLYTLLMSVDGEWTRWNVGFRRLEIKGNLFLVNGKPVKFKGVNLHEHNMFTGHYTTREDILKDLKIMREHNINAIRTCHYPQPRAFYELCDSLGFYVYDEANIESHAMGYRLDRTLGNNPDWYEHHRDRTLNMYYRPRNYACVTILSLGNEAGNGCNFYNTYNALKELEKDGQNRPVCYERAEHEWNTDMHVPQYPGADWFRRMGEQGYDKPVCPSEYAHAMGNSTGSLDLQWSYIYKYDHLQGAFIWDWVDQGLFEVDENGSFYFTYGGDYGVNPPSDANFCCNGVVNPDRNPHPGAAEVKHVYQNIEVSSVNAAAGVFSVFNRYYFTSLNGYELRWAVMADGKAVKQGAVKLSAEPQSAQQVVLSLPKMAADKMYTVDFQVVTLDGDALLSPEFVVAHNQVVLQEAGLEGYMPKKGGLQVTRKQGDGVTGPASPSRIVVSAGKNSITFNEATGILESYIINGKELIADGFGLQPNFWRAPTDNDYGNGQERRAEQWKSASKNVKCGAQVVESEKSVAITAAYELPTGNQYTLEYTFYANGILSAAGSLSGREAEKPVDIPRVGLRFHLPASADTFSYYARGPQENYVDRFTGTDLGLFTTSAEAEYYPYVRPQENGHHIDCRYISIGGVTIVADGSFEFNVLRNCVEDFDLGQQKHINDIEPRDFVEVCIDGAAGGVGGYDSWGSRPEPARTVWSNNDYSFKFTIVPEKALTLDKAIKYKF